MVFKNLKWFCSPIDDATFASYNCIRCDTFWKNLCQIPSLLYRSSAIHVFITKIPEALHSRIFSLGDVFFSRFHLLNEHEAIFNIKMSCVFALVKDEERKRYSAFYMFLCGRKTLGLFV